MAEVVPMLGDFVPPVRKLPHSIEAEMALLGAIMLNRKAYDKVSDYLKPEHFALLEHRAIYKAAAGLINAGRLADALTLKAYLEQTGELAAAGGVAYLGKLVDCAVTVSNASEYGRLVLDLHQRRELIELGEEVVNRAYVSEVEEPAAVQIEKVMAALQNVEMGGDWLTKSIETADDMIGEGIPPRHWLLGSKICREFCTVVVAGGGTGKTTLAYLWAVSLATGRPLSGDWVARKKRRVLILTAEDGREEAKRRIAAVKIAHKVGKTGDNLVIACVTGKDAGLVEPDERGAPKPSAFARRLSREIKERCVDVLIIDPWVKVSGADTFGENENGASDAAMRVITAMAAMRNIAIVVMHHVRKGDAAPGDMDMARGAKALIDAARCGLTLTKMTQDEAGKFGVDESQRWAYVRIDDGKLNISPPAAKAQWYRLKSVDIQNGNEEYPNGDNVQSIEPWTPPAALDGMDDEAMEAILDEIERGLADGRRYSAARNASQDRSAWCVVKRHMPGRTEQQCKSIINEWLRDGTLRQSETRHGKGGPTLGLFVDRK